MKTASSSLIIIAYPLFFVKKNPRIFGGVFRCCSGWAERPFIIINLRSNDPNFQLIIFTIRDASYNTVIYNNPTICSFVIRARFSVNCLTTIKTSWIYDYPSTINYGRWITYAYLRNSSGG